MIHLSYHPAFDAFHCIFRFLRVIDFTSIKVIESDKLCILDYYMLFPWRASAVRLAPKDLGVRRIAKRLEALRDYATLPNGEALLERMKPSQTAALQTLAQDGVIDILKLRDGVVAFNIFNLPDELQSRIKSSNKDDADRLNLIAALSTYPLLGPEGLKSRHNAARAPL